MTPQLNLIMTHQIRLKILPTLLEVYLGYISCCVKEAFVEDKYDQRKKNGKVSLVFRVITK